MEYAKFDPRNTTFQNSLNQTNMHTIMIRFCTFMLLFFSLATASAQERIDLWEGTPMPNSRGVEVADSIANHRVYKVGRPALYRVAPTPEENRGIAMVICPGGGYQRYAWEVAGWDIARWLAKEGITGFILTARLPLSPDTVTPELIGTQDLQRALQLIRAHASEWGIDPEKIGVEGSSAGGHLAATAGVATELLYPRSDAISHEPHHPNFMVLVSPVITLRDPYTHRGSRAALLGDHPTEEQLHSFSIDEQVTTKTPPTLLFHAHNDRSVPCENSIRMYEALRAQGVVASLHIFPEGGHAISLETQPAGTELWKELTERWIDLLYGPKNETSKQ